MKISLTNGMTTRVSAADYPDVSRYEWYGWRASQATTFYAVRYVGRRTIYMHRAILGLRKRSRLVDHVDGDGLNNLRRNLRACNSRNNARNRRKSSARPMTSRFVGVSQQPNGRWRAYISARVRPGARRRGQIHLGTFATEVAAVRVRDKAARQLFGRFAVINLRGRR